jgi:acetylornithine deacetylase/succinyl-diaminopimelate desuccinylase-like protein
MRMDDVYAYIAAHQDAALAELRAFCAQPSVSAEGRGLAEMAAITAQALERRGFRVEQVSLAGGYPVIYAESLDPTPPGAPTLLIYNHYDVQPEGDPALWTCPPFDLTLRDGLAIGRGAADTKGNIVSRLAAIDALRAAGGALPIRIKWVIEGEEETGSQNLDAFLAAFHDRLAADGCLWEFGTFHWDGTPQLMLGMKGMLTVELGVEGPNRDLHSSMAAYVSSPVWRLVWALATLKDESEYVLIDGFYDSMRPPSTADLALLKQLPDDTAARLASTGLTDFAMGLSGYQLRVAEVFSPTCNIHGLWAGYEGEGSKTILPREAHAKLDLRLVPDQDPDEILRLLRRHLDEKGFSDVTVTQIEGSLAPARTDPSGPFVALARAACAELSDRAPLVHPSSAASGPMSSFTRGLGLPVVALGCGYPGSATHAPDENIRVADFVAGTKLIALLIARMAEADLSPAKPITPAESRGEAAPLDEEGPWAEPGDNAPAVADPAAALDPFGDFELETGLAPIDFAALAAEMAWEAPAAPAASPAAAAPAAAPPRPRRRRGRKK